MNLNYTNGTPEKPMIPQGLILETLRSLLVERGEIALPAVGFSMGPIFQAAESLVIRTRSSGSPLHPGAIVVFERDSRWFAHRLWMKWGGAYLTGGDATWSLDWPPIKRERIEGLVVALWRNGQRIDLSADSDGWRRPRWVVGGIFRILWKRVSGAPRFALKRGGVRLF